MNKRSKRIEKKTIGFAITNPGNSRNLPESSQNRRTSIEKRERSDVANERTKHVAIAEKTAALVKKSVRFCWETSVLVVTLNKKYLQLLDSVRP